MNITVRRAVSGDIPVLCRLEEECFSQPWSAKAFADFFDSPCSLALAAEFDGEVVGYVTLYVMDGEGEIANLAVSPAHRRAGIGRTLMRHLMDEEHLTRLMLDVRESNAAARALYGGLGFAVDGRRKRFYSHPAEDGILMSINLSGKDISC